jgi:hypothetical protein
MSQSAFSGSSAVNLWAGLVAAACLSGFLGACTVGTVPNTVSSFCSALVGPVSGPNVANVGTIQQCNNTFPTCNSPPANGTDWQCCASLAQGPVQPGFQCMPTAGNPTDAGAE